MNSNDATLQTPDAADASSKPRTRVFIVDDHAMFRDGLRQLINLESDLTVCGEAANAAQSLTQIRQSHPDLVIADISLPGGSGIELIKTLKSEFADMPVLVVSMHDESLYAERALRAGAMGFVMKSEPAATVVEAIRIAIGGDVYVSDKMASSVVSKFVTGHPPEAASPLESLSERELEVFRMIGQGKVTREIAEEMNVAIPTISTFKNRIKEKLGMKNSTEMILFAIQWFRQETLN